MLGLALVVGCLVAFAFIFALFLFLGARWTKLPHPGFGRALLVGTILIGLSFVFVWLVRPHFPIARSRPEKIFEIVLEFFASATLSIMLILSIQGGMMGRVVLAWLVSQVGAGLIVVAVEFGIKPHLFELYVVPSHAMSPSIRGPHTLQTCPQCGRNIVVPAPDPRDSEAMRGRNPGDEVSSICEGCFTASRQPMPSAATQPSDRIFCNRLKTPKRWDVVCFRSTRSPDTIYAQRLVGLPGETLMIHAGSVWINGERLQPPAAVGPVRYLAPEEDPQSRLDPNARNWGNAETPVVLAADELFLLGDRTAAARDSRYLGPIKKEAIVGVVEIIYAPFDRMRVLP